MKILVYPPIDNGSINPLNSYLYNELSLLECSIGAFKLRGRLPQCDIIHVHWPDSFILGFNAKTAIERYRLIRKQIKRLKNLLRQLKQCKANGTKLVWTVHNIKPHEKGNPIISKYFWWRFLKLVDGLIFLSKTSQAIAMQERPELRRFPAQVIPRGNFKQLADRSPTFKQARNKLKTPYNEFVCLFFGRLRAYKNIKKLAQEFIRAQTGKSRLIIAGDDHPDRTIGDELSRIASRHPNILLDRRVVPDEDMLTYISACDVVVLPYKEILNSAALLMALSCGRRVICPNMGTMAEIAEIVGPEWVYTYEDGFDAKVLEDFRTEFQNKPAVGPAPLPKAFDWPEVANATQTFYRTLLKTPHAASLVSGSNINQAFVQSGVKGTQKK